MMGRLLQYFDYCFQDSFLSLGQRRRFNRIIPFGRRYQTSKLYPLYPHSDMKPTPFPLQKVKTIPIIILNHNYCKTNDRQTGGMYVANYRRQTNQHII